MASGTGPVVAELEHIRKTYGSGDTTVIALDDLSMSVRRGEYVAVMGTSGSGKSTAMNILGCLDRPTSGSYRLNGTAVEQLSDDQLADLRNRELGFVFQQFHLLQELTALENVMLPMVYAGVPAEEREQRGIRALERIGLGERLYNKPNQLSGGQQQRVAIARALVKNPKLVIADEPTANLDTETATMVIDLMRHLGHQVQTTFLIATHDDRMTSRCDSRLKLQDGLFLGHEAIESQSAVQEKLGYHGVSNAEFKISLA